MKIAFRTDSSVALGTGHLMRCLTLARLLRSLDAEIHFVVLSLEGSMTDILQTEGFTVHLLPIGFTDSNLSIEGLLGRIEQDAEQDAFRMTHILQEYGPFDWVVIDHYAFDAKWEAIVYKHTKRILVIDDLANRPHCCDVLLDQNFHPDMESRYDGLVPADCVRLFGPKYVLFRPEFRKIKKPRIRTGPLRNLLVFFGGSDSTNETAKTLNALRLLKRNDLHVDVVVGGANPHHLEIRELCEKMPGTVFHRQIDYMAELMNKADCAIGAGGSATWERCLLGLPALIVILAENQRISVEELEQERAFINLGWHEAVSPELICERLQEWISRPEQLGEMSRRASLLVPAEGLFEAEDWKNLFLPQTV